ncbi:MAG: hypothetical protein ABJE95_22285 [Byssovorax sp.]
MPDPTPAPLDDLERHLVARLLEARTKIAWRFTLIVALLDALFCVRLWASAMQSQPLAKLAIGVVGTAALALLLFGVTWRVVLAMQRDLRNGVKQSTTGTVRVLTRFRTQYGETITRVTIGSEELMTKEDTLAAAREGQTLSVDYLPLCREVLRASVVE